MKTTSEYISLLKQFKDSKSAIYGIHRIGLFGSVARGEQKEGSDVDVCYEGIPKGFFAVCGLKRDLDVRLMSSGCGKKWIHSLKKEF